MRAPHARPGRRSAVWPRRERSTHETEAGITSFGEAHSGWQSVFVHLSAAEMPVWRRAWELCVSKWPDWPPSTPAPIRIAGPHSFFSQRALYVEHARDGEVPEEQVEGERQERLPVRSGEVAASFAPASTLMPRNLFVHAMPERAWRNTASAGLACFSGPHLCRRPGRPQMLFVVLLLASVSLFWNNMHVAVSIDRPDVEGARAA